MHGREGDPRKQRRHMWSVPAPSTLAAADSTPFTPDFFSKDGRKIRVGECALFKPLHDSPPFIGIIRKLLTPGKEDILKLGVNWLYRPADVKLKGALLEAAPNEVFYSFHKDEIPAASLLHPCKVAFLCEGVELPSGISSFVCRRVYDIENKCLYWLTDQDYLNKRQEEVNQLLDKTRLEMHGAVQSGGRSPKPLNGPTSIPQLKPGSESGQNSASSFPHVKGKKRERGDQGSDPVKRERVFKNEDGESGQIRPENMLKSEISKITEKGGLVDLENVKKLVQLMQPESPEKKIDLGGRIMLVDVIGVTDSYDCLERFVHLRGLPVLNEWLQEVHKGKIGNSSSPKESDRSVEDFLLALLRALDKLPVNLQALQTCHVGKSVNHLRSHKNPEIQKKARSLVDTWKKRVEAEMDAKSGLARGISWPTKQVPSDTKSPIIHPSGSKMPPIKLGPGESVAKFASLSPGATKPSVMTSSIASPPNSNTKDLNPKMVVGVGSSDQPLTTIKEEKSSSSSHSHNNSQSCSSDHAKTVGSSCREDARSSTAGSVSVSKISSGGSSRHRKSNNYLSGSAVSGNQKEAGLGKSSPSSNLNATSEKTQSTSERVPDVPSVDSHSQRLIVRLPNTVRSPARSANIASFEDITSMFSRASPPGHSERHALNDRKVKGRADTMRANIVSNMKMESVLGRENEDKVSPTGEDSGRLMEASKVTGSSSAIAPKSGKSYEASFSSMNALVESCVKFSEAGMSPPVGDDIGMNLLASVAAGEMYKSDLVSPLGSPRRTSPIPEDSSCSGNDAKYRRSDENGARSAGQVNSGSKDGDPMEGQGNNAHTATPASTNFPEDKKTTTLILEEKTGEYSGDLQAKAEVSCSTNEGKPFEPTRGVSTKEGNMESMMLSDSIRANSNGVFECKTKVKSPMFGEVKKVNGADEISAKNRTEAVSDAATTSAEVEKEEVEESPCSSSEMAGKDKINGLVKSSGSVFTDQKPPTLEKIPSESMERKNEDPISRSSSGNVLGKAEKVDDVKPGGPFKPSEKQGARDHNDVCRDDISERKEASGHCSGGPTSTHEETPVSAMQKTEPCDKSCKLDRVETDQTEEHASDIGVSSRSAAGSEMSVMLSFDLNEGFPSDEGHQVDIVKSPVAGNASMVHLPCPLPFSSMSGGFPASITVAAAAKGPFVHPENLVRSKGELGWKGSAATSAFRPAEPRKILEMPLCTTEAPAADIKQARAPLDIDLNVADERVLDDMPTQNSARATSSETWGRGSSGLDLDLNRLDESPDIGQFQMSSSSRLEIPPLLGRSSLFSNGDVGVSRDFDLNNGPGMDEVGQEPAPRSQLPKSNVPFLSQGPGIRMNGTEVGNFSSWFPPGNSYSAMAIPSILPSRGEHSFPIGAAAAGSQRVFGPRTGTNPFGPEIYRGAVLSSSPAVSFPPTAPPFQYSGFPFDANFPLSSNSFSGCSTAYMDSSSGGPLCFPGISSQLGAPTGMMSSPYPRPFVMNLPGGASNNGGPESRKWGGQGLDLNSGPGTGSGDIERRDERLPVALRQLSVASSQAIAEEQLRMFQMAGAAMKRKEPDGGWDTTDRFSYKPPSWQ